MERLQREFADARLVKAFNSVGNSLMVNPQFAGGKPTRWPGSGKATGRAESVGAIAPAGYDQGGEHRGIVRVSGAELWPSGCIGQ